MRSNRDLGICLQFGMLHSKVHVLYCCRSASFSLHHACILWSVARLEYSLSVGGDSGQFCICTSSIKVFRLRSETLDVMILLRYSLTSQTLLAKCARSRVLVPESGVGTFASDGALHLLSWSERNRLRSKSLARQHLPLPANLAFLRITPCIASVCCGLTVSLVLRFPLNPWITAEQAFRRQMAHFAKV